MEVGRVLPHPGQRRRPPLARRAEQHVIRVPRRRSRLRVQAEVGIREFLTAVAGRTLSLPIENLSAARSRRGGVRSERRSWRSQRELIGPAGLSALAGCATTAARIVHPLGGCARQTGFLWAGTVCGLPQR